MYGLMEGCGEGVNIVLKPKKVTLFFAIIVTCLTLAHIAGKFSALYLGYDHVLGLVPLFDLEREENIPTLYSSIAILFCSALLAIIAFAKKKNGELNYRYWLGLAVIFLFLSIDESVSIHERLRAPVRSLLNPPELLYAAWVIPYGIALIIFLFVYLKFIINLPAKTRLLFILAGLIYVMGALGLEIIGGPLYKVHRALQESDSKKAYIPFVVVSGFEELLEMVGIVVFMYALMSYIDSDLKGLCLRITSSSENS